MDTNASLSLANSPNTKQAWILISVFSLVLSLLILAGVGLSAALFFFLGSVSLGGYLYFKHPHLYVGFVWWLWFVGPLIRRLIDFRRGSLTPGHFMLTPSLVALISIITFVKYLPRFYKNQALPFVLCAGSIFYGFVIGVVYRNPLNSNIYGTLQILGPLFFGYHLFTTSYNYPLYRKTILRVFLWGVIVMGVYGIAQRLFLPSWDQFYLLNIEKEHQIAEGIDSTFGLFSTTEGRQQFAGLLAAGLILILCQEGKLLGFMGAALGYLTLLLSRARAGWLSWLVSLVLFIPSLKPKLQVRIVSVVCISGILVIPLTTMEPFSTFISDRVGSLSDIEGDNSLYTRRVAYNFLFAKAITEVVGKGIGLNLANYAQISTFDGAILPMFFWLGWLGIIFFSGGIAMLLCKLLTASISRTDSFANASRAIAIGIFIQIGFNLIFIASLALVFWGFLGMALAANSYYKSPRQNFGYGTLPSHY
ncbi:O-antigen ligase domain-containing protein [Acaryochloris sp. IP29b_bin.148]|uniref:O-antigen ligase domain-containing protein n=1 Tax=Acaryochloris sp. IP29b_bin.148 TaxID=2969218 RepID=UPI0026375E91|nr:O-antigen ligase domain-containing protein [Acaryochloris sp. IP29b_bin.148]